MFLDTNVLVSAFATRGLCADVLELLAEHELVMGKAVVAELVRVLRHKVRLPAPRSDDVAGFLRDISAVWIDSSTPSRARVDPDDAVILGEALAGRSEIFVTGDVAVQRVAEAEGMKIFSPRAFWNYLQSVQRTQSVERQGMGSAANAPTTRRLAAILIADVAGYTRLMERDDTGTFARLRSIRDEVGDPAIAVDRIVPGYTVAQLRAKRYSEHPEYLKLAERYWYDGLRKAGLPGK